MKETTNKTSEIKGWVRILLIIIPYFSVVGGFQYLGYLVSEATIEKHQEKSSYQHLIVQFFSLIGAFLLLWFFMKFIDKEPFINLGFSIKNRFKEIVFGLMLGLFIMLVGYGILLGLKEITYTQIVLNFTELLLAFGIFVLVAVVEETLLRGYVLRNLMYSFNNYTALIVSALLFSLMHGANPNISWFNLASLFLAGILLGLSYIYTRNLWFPIALHFSWNFFQSLFGFNVSGQDFYSLVEFFIPKSNLLNGGLFGFEGSVISLLFQFISIALIYYYYSPKINLTLSNPKKS